MDSRPPGRGEETRVFDLTMALPTHMSESMRRLNPGLFATVDFAQAPAVKHRLRQQRGGKLNKTEAAFGEHLRRLFPGAAVHEQAITLRLANGCRYSPDVVVVEQPGSLVRAYEVKGHMRDDAAVKLKVAATAYPWISFYLVTQRGGTWEIDRVFP